MCLVKFSNTTIGYWTQELGLSVYKESCSLFKDKRYALIVDESMMIGSEKLLLTLAMPAINAGSAITEKDITIVDISIAKSWNGTSIKNVLEKVADKIGHKPEYVISDNGFTVCKAVRDAGYAHHSDISHTLGAENGGYPPTQNGDIRSLFWLFSLMALQN